MTLRVKEQILRFDVSVGDALAVEVLDTLQDLLETTFDFAWAHSPGKSDRIISRVHFRVIPA
jgi:hypothetical protein